MSISPEKPKIIAIVGPTASGKTDRAITLAQKFNGEIISADSRQIYRGMTIGTAKPTRAELASVPHRLIDIKNPDEPYTVADYKADALAAIEDILRRGKLPIIVGGTGLYVKAVLENLDIPKTVANPELRAQLEKEIEEKGLAAVFERLVTLDPEAAYVVDPKNPRRVVRALEVAITTGEPFTAQRKKNEPLFNALIIGLDPAPEILRERIDRRIDEMINAGLAEEVAMLIKKYGTDQVAFDAIGYREIVEHVSGEVPLATAIAAMKMNTWHYAKRQMTWFKKDKNVRWIKNPDEAMPLVNNFLQRSGG
jgi:tRNA dimethylallyltransferase